MNILARMIMQKAGIITIQVFLLSFVFAWPSASQAEVSTHVSYEELLRRTKNVAPLDESLFGDKINLQDGSLAFSQTDVSLSTNSRLAVSFGRKSANLLIAGDGMNVFGERLQ